MILTAHQPSYLPWLGLFHKISLADEFCFYDDVQFTRKDFISRNLIKSSSGPILLSVPVTASEHREKKLNEIQILNNGWVGKHLKSIQLNYSKAPYFKVYFEELEQILTRHKSGSLAELNIASTKYFMRVLGLETKVRISSDLGLIGNKTQRIIDMCEKLEADKYIFGSLGREYADEYLFRESAITPYFQQYLHPIYPQQHGKFLSNLSVIDLLFNMGPASLQTIISGNSTKGTV